ncbi:MAG: amidohydrolase [Bacteroides sp.]|nr:amidohydrolase [Bacteroides sp.]
MDSLRITLLQTDIAWENKQENLNRLYKRLMTLRGETDLIVLPEMFSTGFSMNVGQLEEPVAGPTIRTLQQWASEFQMAIAGSYMACDEQQACHQENSDTTTARCYNRAFFLTPEGDAWYYDKRHLFRMGLETDHFYPGTQRPIIHYRGWNILLLVCYDLRFPVWSRNVGNEYDLLIYVANWPVPRRRVWDILLQARALENQCYTCGINRVGMDGNGLAYNGGSILYDAKGKTLASVNDNEEGIATATLSPVELQAFRKKFPVWMDADSFTILSDNNSR